MATSTTRGTKVTTDPASTNNPIEEGTGVITSDSLAAESLRSGGDFAANQESEPGISGQTSKGFTGNTTDTSGARKVPSGIEDPSTTQAELDADRSGGKAAGVGPTYNKTGPSSSSSAGVAPIAQQTNIDPRVLQPKGENLKEGGEVTGNEKNTSFSADIGSRDDPGLAAEQKFQKVNADQAAAAGFQRDSKFLGEGGYEVLDREERA